MDLFHPSKGVKFGLGQERGTDNTLVRFNVGKKCRIFSVCLEQKLFHTCWSVLSGDLFIQAG